jgi:hypothetical protein
MFPRINSKTFRLSALRLGIVAALALAAVDCAPQPESARCRNDAACRSLGGKFQYCSRSKCVECVTHAACGNGFVCANGSCEVK